MSKNFQQNKKTSSPQMTKKNTSKKSAKKAGLGRGLNSLLGSPQSPQKAPPVLENNLERLKQSNLSNSVNSLEFKEKSKTTASTTAVAKINPEDRVWRLRVDHIKPNEKQPRKEFEATALKELSESIKQNGLLQPITVRKLGDKNYQIIAGERRWRACQQAGLQEVPALIKNYDDQKTLELALVENIQREDLNPLEEALAYDHLMATYGFTQQQMADKVGKDRATVANSLRLLRLSEPVQNMVAGNKLSLGQAKVLVAVDDDKAQRKIAKKVIEKGLSVRATEALVKKFKMGVELDFAAIANTDEVLIKRLKEDLQKVFGTKVTIDYKGGKGKLSVHYYSDSELNKIVDTIKKS